MNMKKICNFSMLCPPKRKSIHHHCIEAEVYLQYINATRAEKQHIFLIDLGELTLSSPGRQDLYV